MYLKLKTIGAQWKTDTRGSFAMVWGVSAMVVLMAIGAAFDLTNLNHQKEQGQKLADLMALAASVAIDRENDDRFVEGQAYTFHEVTGSVDASSASLSGSVEYDIVDDEDPNNIDQPEGEKSRLLARATVSGEYASVFLSILPQLENIHFEAKADVAYSLAGGKPASVFFAVDNSGSMGWLDSSGSNKLLSLESSMRRFMDILDTVNTDQNDIFRSALYPYSQDYNGRYNTIDDDGVIPNRVVAPAWGTLTNGKINSMSTLYGTDSSGALEDAAADFESESAKHLAMNNTADPLKYMIFMSDGSNNSSYECKTESVWVDGEDEYWIYYKKKKDWKKKKKGKYYYRYYSWMSGEYVDYYPGTDAGYEDQETCSWDYHADTQSIASCNAMKEGGVTVYSIGYSLIAGQNGVSQSDVTRAKDLLQSCASTSDHYILAANADQLDTVFEEIGKEIIEEVIRIKR